MAVRGCLELPFSCKYQCCGSLHLYLSAVVKFLVLGQSGGEERKVCWNNCFGYSKNVRVADLLYNWCCFCCDLGLCLAITLVCWWYYSQDLCPIGAQGSRALGALTAAAGAQKTFRPEVAREALLARMLCNRSPVSCETNKRAPSKRPTPLSQRSLESRAGPGMSRSGRIWRLSAPPLANSVAGRWGCSPAGCANGRGCRTFCC